MEEEATALMTIILASSIIFELIGPACAKLGLYLSHSYGHDKIDDLVPESQINGGVVVEEGSSKEVEKLAAQIYQISKEIKPLEPEEQAEQAFNEAAEEYENENSSRNYRRFINRK